jgi:hypothetical protein
MYLVVSTGGDVTEKELQRELGVAQKTAGRMLHQIATLLPSPIPGGIMARAAI